MPAKTIGAARFKAECLRIIDLMTKDGEAVTITKRGKPVALLTPLRDNNSAASLFGSMRSPGYSFDDPFSPAADPNDWDVSR